MLDALHRATVAALLTHEPDAVKRHEWRVLPLTSVQPGRVGEQAFIRLHVPPIFAILRSGGAEPVSGVRLGLAGLAGVHVGLHWLVRRHPRHEFGNPSSRAPILLAGALGGACLLAALA